MSRPERQVTPPTPAVTRALEKMPDPEFWKEQAKQAKGKPLLCIVDDYSCEGLDKTEKRNMEMMLSATQR